MRGTSDTLSFYRALEERPFDHDFYHALRLVECLHPGKPRLGQALRRADEPVRLGQEPSLSFAPSALSAFIPSSEGRAPRLEVRFFGLLGPNGPMPTHITDFVRERLLHAGDATLARFLDVFNHRFLALFYRAWAQAQPTVSLDRPHEDRFSIYVGALAGIAGARVRQRDAVGDDAKRFYCGLLARQVRNRDGLEALLGGYFGIALQVEQFVGHWMHLPLHDRTRLGADSDGAKLGIGTVLGSNVWDRQHKFRVHLGPLQLKRYEDFLPGGTALPKLVALVRQYLCFELEWDVCLVLARVQIPRLRLGQYGRLGWTTWLGRRAVKADAADLTLDAERVLARHEENHRRRARATAPAAIHA
jgi:type VI secretion system protein ImpH